MKQWTLRSVCVAMVAACLLLATRVVFSAEPARSVTLQKPPWSDPAFLPIAVWLQSPANAERYRAAGINTYVALWKGPTEEQITALKKAGMRLICSQNQAGLRYRDDPWLLPGSMATNPTTRSHLVKAKVGDLRWRPRKQCRIISASRRLTRLVSCC